SEVARLLDLEILIVALAAGFWVENFARAGAGERLRSELKRCLVPATAVFFAVSGAGLRLGVLADVWPWALLFVGVRAVSLRYGVRWAGRRSGVTPVLAREGWPGLISQARTAVALACSEAARLAPLLPPCTASANAINLDTAAYLAIDPAADSGCVTFAANPSAVDSIEYLLVPQSAAGTFGDSAPFQLQTVTLA